MVMIDISTLYMTQEEIPVNPGSNNIFSQNIISVPSKLIGLKTHNKRIWHI